MPGSTVVRQMSASTLTAAVLRAWARPTWIFCPPIMIAPRTDTRRVTISGSGSYGGWAVPPRAPRSRDLSSGGTGQAAVRGQDAAGQDVMTGPSSRGMARRPANGSPALITAEKATGKAGGSSPSRPLGPCRQPG